MFFLNFDLAKGGASAPSLVALLLPLLEIALHRVPTRHSVFVFLSQNFDFTKSLVKL